MLDHPFCNHCSQALPGDYLTLWDGQDYCRKCIDKKSWSLYEYAQSHAQLEETIATENISGFKFIAYLSKGFFITIFIFFGLPLGLAVLAGKGDIWVVLSILIFFYIAGMVMLLLTCSMILRSVRPQFPRTISIYNGKLFITTPKEKKIYLLKDCRWFFGDTQSDQITLFTGLRRGVVIQPPEPKLVNSARIACGHSEEQREYWRDFLELAQVSQIPPFRYLVFAAHICIGMIIGTSIGAFNGLIFSLIAKDNVWIFTSSLTGFGAGILIAILVYGAKNFDDDKVAYWRLNPLFFGFAFLLIGMRFGVLGNMLHAFILSAVNAFIVALVVWYFREKIQKAKAKL